MIGKLITFAIKYYQPESDDVLVGLFYFIIETIMFLNHMLKE